MRANGGVMEQPTRLEYKVNAIGLMVAILLWMELMRLFA